MSDFENVSVGQLQEARIDLDHQIAALRERKLAIAQEIERRIPEEEPEERPAMQTLTPDFIEAESDVLSPAGPIVPDPRRRWWRT